LLLVSTGASVSDPRTVLKRKFGPRQKSLEEIR
jgi:hypothetical protein